MNWTYKLFWTSSLAVAVAVTMSACAVKKEEGAARKNVTKTAPGTTAARTGNTTTVTTNDGATLVITNKPNIMLADPYYGSANTVTSTAQFMLNSTRESKQLSITSTHSLEFPTDIYSDAIPGGLLGNWNGGYVAKCSDSVCSVYSLIYYLANDKSYFMTALRFQDGYPEVTYTEKTFKDPSVVFAELEEYYNKGSAE